MVRMGEKGKRGIGKGLGNQLFYSPFYLSPFFPYPFKFVLS
jgi:hypothetical protein